ncbi:putative glycosyl hydrolase family 61 [Lyophyllum shimeji]|uniref:lytic cellulose monooxygenase (C4-dehydrogenating) n=1 Tax=Lyophyllum shimeji TaxID=47721 RepID=A0A9P3ULH9_LYOSH|nr:putative glycosyl hydrolase family 61 [Lyophyllum shimeji]
MLCLTIFSAVWVAAVMTGVEGHGFVHSVVMNGQEYPGWNPFSDPYTTAPPKTVRKVLNDGFVSATDPDLPCHHLGNEGTALVADATAGSQVTFRWSYWPADHQGPVSTYMASCNGDCTTFLASNARWFKLDAAGYDPSTRQWAADQLRANDNSWVSTIPAGIAPGQYLMRNEIVALHSITPQFYPSCSQVKVSGSGNGQPSESDLVSIPGLYSNVTWPNIYSDFGTFQIPGPPPVTFGVGGNPPSITTTTTTSALSTPTAGPTQVSNMSMTTSPVPSSQASGHCLLNSRRLVRRTSK